MELILENAVVIAVVITIGLIGFAAFLASPYEIYFEDAEETEEI